MLVSIIEATRIPGLRNGVIRRICNRHLSSSILLPTRLIVMAMDRSQGDTMKASMNTTIQMHMKTNTSTNIMNINIPLVSRK